MSLTDFLRDVSYEQGSSEEPIGENGIQPIAIIGIGCRFPGGVNGPADYWRLLSTGQDAIREIPADRWDVSQYYDPSGKPGKINSRWGGFIEGFDQFDAQFFGISPREASRMDPQQRVILEVAYEALEDAGQDLSQLAGSNSGVFVGISSYDYGCLQAGYRDRTAVEGYNSTGNALSIAANRISYFFDFRGPSTAVDTACSSALTAVHLACESIWRQRCQIALAGGVSILTSIDSYIGFSRLGMLSPDGRCKAFDSRANGYVRSEGAGMIVLKPLAQALKDGDRIYAAIRATAINQDGRSSGLTVPNQESQEALVRAACRQAGVKPTEIQYVEAHGTGTPVGDPIEARALGSVMSDGRPVGDSCVIGSAKTNIGHLEAASGIAGLIKTALALKHRLIPPNLHFQRPNPEIPFEDLKLRVARELEVWPADPGQGMAGINSFGFGGSNAHALVSEAPQGNPEPAAATFPMMLPLSARSREGLLAVADSYRRFIEGNADLPLPDLLYNTARRRTHYDHRLALVCNSREHLIEALTAGAAGEEHSSVVFGQVLAGGDPQLLWVFCGQGPQWWAMGRELLEHEPVFRDMIRKCDELIGQWSDWSLWKEITAEESESRLQNTSIAQPAIFAIQVGLAALWQSWGVRPGAIVGHSVGEVAAAYVAGVLTMEDAVQVIFHRGRCMQFAEGNGRMLAVGLSLEASLKKIAPFDGKVGIAAINGPSSITLSGEAAGLEQLALSLERDGVFCRFLTVPYAFHSAQMDAAQAPLLEALREIKPQPAKTPLFSSVTGEVANGFEWGADYWWQNVRRPVRFADSMGHAAAAGYQVALEIAPHPVLGSSILECFQQHGVRVKILPSLRRGEPERIRMLQSLGALYTLGWPVRWESLIPSGQVISLPSYPWQRERHWHESEESSETRIKIDGHPLLGQAAKDPLPTWESHVGTQALDYLKDHCLQDHPILPATGYLEMALSAAKVVFPDGPYALEEVRFAKACFLDDGETLTLRTTYQPSDSSFQIFSRPTGNGHSWTQHASGILRSREFSSTSQLDLDAIRTRCTREISPAACYKRLKDWGLVYGENFQGIQRLWCGRGEALGQIRLPDVTAKSGNDYQFHPALLDSCLQVLFGTLAALDENSSTRREVYLPVEIAEVRVQGVPGDQVWSYARLVEKTRQGILTDVTVFNAAGDVVWQARGLGCQYLNLEESTRQENSDELTYAYRWEFQPRPVLSGRSARHLRSPEQVAVEVREAAALLREDQQIVERHQSFEAATARLCASYVWNTLHDLAGPLPQSFTLETLANHLGSDPKHNRLLGRFLKWLEEDGMLRREDLTWEVSATSSYEDPSVTWRTLFTQHPGYFPEMMLIGNVGRHLPDLLRGTLNPLQEIFPDGSLGISEHLYQDAPYVRYHDHVARDVVDRLTADLPAGKMLRVLEIGAGTGSLTSHVLPHLPQDRTEYVFTDLSNHFLSHGQQKFRDTSFVRYQTLDINLDPVEQGFATHSFDLVLALSVLHATADLRQTLTNIRKVLSSEGALVLIESVRPIRWVEMVFGLTEGWSSFSDRGLRTDHPLLSSSQWATLLGEEGFNEVQDVTDTRDTGLDLGVIVARGPRLETDVAETIAPETKLTQVVTHVDTQAVTQAVTQTDTQTDTQKGQWVMLADRQGVGARLADMLCSRGEKCELVFSANNSANGNGSHLSEFKLPDDLLRLLRKECVSEIRGLVYMWNLDAPETNQLDPDELLGFQEVAALNLVSLVNACSEVMDAEIPIYVVTRRAFAVEPNTEQVELTQSPLIGLNRVIMNEYPKFRCTTIDLGGVDLEAEVRGLAEELFSDTDAEENEDEIALRGEVRYVHRYSPQTVRKQILVPASDTQPFRLQTDPSNTIDGLSLQASRREAPGPDEVEIEVVAAGLNFSDVLKAVGLYPGLPDGPIPLGLECSGRVVAIGSQVREFQVGDAVLALASHTFSAYVKVNTALVAHKPEHVGFEEAATIPIAFLTAYHALHSLGNLTAGEKLLVHAASGGVGMAAIQLARNAGAEVLATAGNNEKRQLLKALGITHVMDSRSLKFADDVLEATGGAGVDLILNSLPGEAISKGLSVLADYGRFLEIGKRDIYQNSRLGMAPFRKNLSFIAVDLDRSLRRGSTAIAEQFRKVIEAVRNKELFPLPYRTFPVTNIREAFRYMAHGKHLGKIVVSFKGHRPLVAHDLETPPAVSRGATYLVTGGLSGFGLAAAQWLVDERATHLVLVSRRGLATPGAEEAVAAIRNTGAEVLVHNADVSNTSEVAEMFDRIKETMPPVRGVIHAAMVLDDCQLANLTRERWHQVQAPKAAGAWNLHLYTERLPLDFFVCFSSMSSVFGIAGQSNYAAANSFLDALASYRRAKGLPSLTINWGYLGEVGYVARNEKIGQRFENWGLQSISPREAFSILRHLIGLDTHEMGVMRVDWPNFQQPGISKRLSRRFAELAVGAETDVSGPGTDSVSGRQLVLAATGPQRKELLESLLRNKVARVLGASASDLNSQKPLNELGLDSIMGVELRNWIADDLRVDLPVVEIVRGPSMDHLVNLLLGQLDKETEASAIAQVPSEANGSSEPASDEVLSKVANLSNQEVESMLRALSTTGG